MVVFWFRRDLRLDDNAGLYEALKRNKDVQPIFIFDTSILSKLDNPYDSRVAFIHATVLNLKQELDKIGSDLWIFHGEPMTIFNELVEKHQIDSVYANRDYEPSALKRDRSIHQFLNTKGIRFIGKKDHVIFDKSEIVKDDSKPYSIFTPYSKKWKAKLSPFYYAPYPTELYQDNFRKADSIAPPISLQSIGFNQTSKTFPSSDLNRSTIKNYHLNRDFPAIDGTTRLSLHLRFGTISIRKCVAEALKSNEKWLSELIWRDFYQMILLHFPESVDLSFKRQYESIEWNHDEEKFNLWCQGKTGYPIVDAGMRELNETGFMHNRVRMITASFLIKHLLIDWRWGERYFASKLLDFDLASNVGGWQWAAGSGCDAAPYFRIFNPYQQQKKFDPEFRYVKKWVTEYGTLNYPEPIVDHKQAREDCLIRFKKALLST